MSTITLTDVSKSWDDFEALKDINLTCEEGQLLVLLGPSGCGKSTTLRLIAGLETPTSGSIKIGGREVADLPPVKRDISMVFQNYALFPHLSVAENILFGLKARKVDKAEQEKRLKNASGILGLDQFLNRKPAQLSGGQRQRVALGRAIVAQVPVCLMDEPLSNLDAKLRQEMRQEIRSLQQRLGMTMVYVTHDQVEAMTIADKIILMKGGGIEQHGTPAELYNKPATAFTGAFIGNPPMNIMKPTEAMLSICAAMIPDSVKGEELLIGVRPENIEIREDVGCEVTVSATEYLGADTLITCRVGEQTFIVSTQGRLVIPAGDTIKVGWSLEHAHLFNARDGKRIKIKGEEA
ncbi:MAG: ABC transporter ATP-binding protein [Thermodesulfobacteriota bacterium]